MELKIDDGALRIEDFGKARRRGIMKRKKTKRPLPRKTWVINPTTRVKESEKNFSREKAKKNFRKELDET